ncbi:MAG TPA: Gx transporter family protein [Candidatus Merdibacter merdigallinarum]|nr:Gx transporter family protein [Candidatus Merdibacter merdigallinarum]
MKRVQKLTLFAMLCALAIVFHYVESMVVIPLPVPGFRLGLANILSLIALYYFDARALFTIGIVRVLFASLLSGMLFATSFWLSLAGMLLSALVMTIARHCSCFSIYGVSVLGSAAHCVAQVMVVTWIYQQFFMQALLPILVALSIPTGLLIAMLADQVLKRLP